MSAGTRTATAHLRMLRMSNERLPSDDALCCCAGTVAFGAMCLGWGEHLSLQLPDDCAAHLFVSEHEHLNGDCSVDDSAGSSRSRDYPHVCVCARAQVGSRSSSAIRSVSASSTTTSCSSLSFAVPLPLLILISTYVQLSVRFTVSVPPHLAVFIVVVVSSHCPVPACPKPPLPPPSFRSFSVISFLPPPICMHNYARMRGSTCVPMSLYTCATSRTQRPFDATRCKYM